MARRNPGQLTKKEKAFCEEFVRNNGNACQAYLAAYDACYDTAKAEGWRLLKKPHIHDYIEALQKEAFAAACINAERVALKLAEIAFAEKDDEAYGATSQLKALDLLQKQLGVQSQKIEANVSTDINIVIDEGENGDE